MESTPNKKRYSVTAGFQQGLQGLKFFSVRNSKGSYVVPSTKNFFDGYKVSKVKIDQGASISLIPVLQPQDLQVIFQRYPPSEYRMQITALPTFGGGALALSVVPGLAIPRRVFDVHLGADVYPNILKDTSYECPDPITPDYLCNFNPCYLAKRLNFFLCSDDVDAIKSEPGLKDRFFAGDCELLDNFTRRDVARRDNALIGNQSLHRTQCSSIKHNGVELFFDTELHELGSLSWGLVDNMTLDIHSRRYVFVDSTEELDSIEPNDIWVVDDVVKCLEGQFEHEV
jgi:hypothetical protein